MAVPAMTQVGALIANPTRASLLVVLMDGRARTGGELARLVGVAPSTASEHLSRLLDAHFIAVDAQGRHRYFRLAGPHIAELVETLGAVAPPDLHAARRPSAPADLVHARSCYDHLAGRLGVAIYDRLLGGGQLHLAGGNLTLTVSGEDLLADLGVDIDAVHRARRHVARRCLDWTERRHHLAGAAGAALFNAFLDHRWIARGQRPRSIVVTATGHQHLAHAFHL